MARKTTKSKSASKGSAGGNRPQCPDHLTDEAKSEWHLMTGQLAQAGQLEKIDRSILALYCQAWARWVQAEKKVHELGPVILSPKTESMMGNPWLSIANKAHDQASKLLIELGVTPKARQKNKSPLKTEPPADLEF